MFVKLQGFTGTVVTLLFSLIFITSVPTRSQAQFIPFFANAGPFLSKKDFTFADVAAHKLMDPRPAPLGTAVAWSNPVSGDSGIVTMGRTYQKSGYDCRVLSWHDDFKNGVQRTVMLNTCHVSGVWKLM